jgi:hypothetical protein
MAAVVTRYGDLSTPSAASPVLVALDLLRAYAHDCLHYGSFREYRLSGGRLLRTAYGINRRDGQGRSYSAPDPPGSRSTRNLGVVMEGATDREARAVVRETAERCGIAEPEDALGRSAHRDTVGLLRAEDTVNRSGASGAERRLTAMAAYERNVGAPYGAFLADVGGPRADDLHGQVLGAVISGRIGPLTEWLDARHGPGTFTALFRAPAYDGPEPGL